VCEGGSLWEYGGCLCFGAGVGGCTVYVFVGVYGSKVANTCYLFYKVSESPLRLTIFFLCRFLHNVRPAAFGNPLIRVLATCRHSFVIALAASNKRPELVFVFIGTAINFLKYLNICKSKKYINHKLYDRKC
jgi:hypothetical protein